MIPIPWHRRRPGTHDSTERFAWWPIALAWASNSMLGVHGWETRADGFERRVYGWTLHLGRLKVMFGDRP